MRAAETGDTVHIHYRGTLDDGSEFHSSRARDPVRLTLGAPGVIAGFQDAVVGMKPGETRRFTVPAAEAYGMKRDDLVVRIEREEFPAHIALGVGQVLQLERADGGRFRVEIVAEDERCVVLDGNHPLAGRDLTFEVELVAIG